MLERGLPVEFDRLRLHWYQGLVADRVQARLPHRPDTLRIEFRQVVLNPHWPALLQSGLTLRSLELLDGQLVAALQAPGEAPEELTLEVARARLSISTNDTWTLDELTARLGQWSLHARGVITNGPALARAARPSRVADPPPAAGAPWRLPLRRLKQQLESLRFVTPPEIHFTFAGDGRDLASFRDELRCLAGGAWTPWGHLRQVQLVARAEPAASGSDLQRLALQLDAADADTPWGSFRDARLSLEILQPFAQTWPARLDWELQAGELRGAGSSLHQARLRGHSTPVTSPAAVTSYRSEFELAGDVFECPWGTCGTSTLTGHATHTLTPFEIQTAAAHLKLATLGSPQITLPAAELHVQLHRPPALPPPATLPSGWPRELAALEAAFSLRAHHPQTPRVHLDRLNLDGHWRFPDLTVTNLHASLYDGELAVREAHLNVLTRDVTAAMTVDFDVQRLDQALPPSALAWLAQFRYPHPPHAEVTVRARLPEWHTPPPDAGAALLASLDLRARLDGRDVVFNDLPADTAGVFLTISNRVLRLRDLTVTRPEGEAQLRYDLDLQTRDFRWRFHSQVDPQIAAPAIDSTLPPILALFDFDTPPLVTGEVWGNWKPPKVVDLALQIAATNFTFRDQPFTSLTAHLAKTNLLLTATDVRLEQATGHLEAPWVQYDLEHHIVALTNARSSLDPLHIAACINTNLITTLEPYHFASPPALAVNGHVQTDAILHGSDLTFAVRGGPFRFWRFNSTQLEGTVRWTGHRLTVTNVLAEFYGGRLSGEFLLDLPPDADPPFQFQARGTDFDLRGLLRDTLGTTNHIEGTATGTLVVTDARVSDWKSWHGYGQARLRDGLLWDLPVFGTLSRVLNFVAPGIGNSRATAAQGRYTITRSVIHSDDLEISAGPAQLRLQGTLDFDGEVDARVVAEVLRKTPIVGPLISLVFAPAAKAFEFRVTGHLSDPHLKPVYVPGFLLPLLNPLGTLQDLVTPNGHTPDRPPR
ncbi:MAG: hypothetical protein HS113_27545 [Verrucomicrobiales bacterium]|nr:hypothetical protein [Verrucomicrobiales bacterium]